MNERIKTEMISRRKALSLLGLGAALGFALSSALEPLEAEAQEATGDRRRARCGHRNTRDATPARAALPSP